MWLDVLPLYVLKISLMFFLFLFQCLTPDVALSALEDDGKSYLTEDDYQRISTVLLYYIINLRDLCVSDATSSSSLSSPSSSSSSGNYQFYLLALTNLHPAEDDQFLSLSETESILQLINRHYHPSHLQETSSDMQVRDLSLRESVSYECTDTIMSPLTPQCIDAAHLLQDVDVKENQGAGESSVPRVAAAIISHILQGHCFRRRNLPSPAFFTDHIFQSLNRTMDLQITGKLNKLLFYSIHAECSCRFL